ncbi:MAG TPA: biopolymer transporter ExbD, partial [Gemmatimonadaceae bacterium]|nr:biopolymer transporter ExbD [Gemmatimonadaceae bacterium]
AVRVENSGLLVEHSEEGGFRQQLPGMDDATMQQLQTLMTEIKQRYPQNSDVLVIPGDDVSYENVVRVLERLKLARYTGISLGTRARTTEVAAGGQAP